MTINNHLKGVWPKILDPTFFIDQPCLGSWQTGVIISSMDPFAETSEIMRNFAVDMTENLIDCMHKKWWFAKQEILSSLCHTHKGVDSKL